VSYEFPVHEFPLPLIGAELGALLIGVGTVIAHDPLHGPGRSLISASGSYLR
jgi:hypothetical protein